ncbi:MAG: enoyl-CoA hydratase/isomerase family protein [Alphaproteobacteria bacterium]
MNDAAATVAQDGEVGIVTLNRPGVLNALDHSLRDAVVAAMAELNADASVRAVVVTGSTDRAFSVGLDMAVSTSLHAGNVEDWLRGVHRLFQSIRAMDKPVVAAMNGVAAGLGLQTALHCDVRIGHPAVRVSQPEIAAGVPSVLGLQILGDLMGLSRTVEMSLRCRWLDAEECLRFGLLHEIVPQDQVLEKAVAIAREMGALPPVAMRLSRRRMREASQAAFDEAIEAAIAMQKESYGSGEPQRLAAAFMARKNTGR